MFGSFPRHVSRKSLRRSQRQRRVRPLGLRIFDVLELRRLLSATVYTVELTTDTGQSTSANMGDLLYCLTQANADPNPDGTEIEFDPSVFSAATPQTITLTNTLILRNTAGPMSIEGPGAAAVTISGGNAVGVFAVAKSVTASIDGVTVTEGIAVEGGGHFQPGRAEPDQDRR